LNAVAQNSKFRFFNKDDDEIFMSIIACSNVQIESFVIVMIRDGIDAMPTE
jgi:hypothetical protein